MPSTMVPASEPPSFLRVVPCHAVGATNLRVSGRTTQRLFRVERCIGCMECVKTCPNNALTANEDGSKWLAANCAHCETYARVCPSLAVEFIGKIMSVEDVVAEISKDTLFYDESRGGVTFSGGEPLMQPSFLMGLLKACGDLDLHRMVDTCGYADTRTLLSVATQVELFLYDLKHMDPEKHYRQRECPMK